MPRTLPSGIELAVLNNNCQFVHLLTFTVGETTYRFSEDHISHLGNAYEAGLLMKGPIRYSEQLRVDPVVLAIQNVTLEIATILKDVAHEVQGQEASLERLYLPAAETLLLFRGRVGEIGVDERAASLTLITEFDPLASRIPPRQYSALCAWNFMDSNCGYVPNEDPLDPLTAIPFISCPKDFTSCEQRGRTHRFPGFLHLTREVSEAVL
jgi:hypothetical protein